MYLVIIYLIKNKRTADMTVYDFYEIIKKWCIAQKEYSKHYKENSLLFPAPALQDYLSLLLPSLKKNPYTIKSGKSVPPSYDFNDGTTFNIELKSSYNFGTCNFSKNQKKCSRIFYANLRLDGLDIYELNKKDVSTINGLSSRQLKLSKYIKNAVLIISVTFGSLIY